MRLILTFMTFLTFAALPALSQAHGDHGSAVKLNESEIMNRALEEVALIVETGERIEDTVLDKSWTDIKTPAFFEKGAGYYIVSVKNETLAKTIYLLMSDTGIFYDVNFTGEFSGLRR